ncbi:WD repeat protein [Ichthyophthirius multifiliis]|uniref:WD repeat protein n=1 Tax=Ichthyophthirius multifiliis TaxID=5932 RepID=G0R5N7_ICHMU|nr:WD repeat protein [Ichthyophthirius multifiliis]EGR27210.1 WD repeat protein [Ichthyophthirius multifiliis]|eukprot:XP_004024094.1 WD repeat protein [Ichthyophthirius multifiliis]
MDILNIDDYLKNQKENDNLQDFSQFHRQQIQQSTNLIPKATKENNLQANQQQVGPQRPQIGAEYSDSSSDSEDEADILKNDPIYMQSINQQKNKTNQQENIQQLENSDEEQEDQIQLEQNKSYQIFPVSHQVILKGHTKKVICLSIDQSGSRLASGSNDYFVRLWDFNGMNQNMNSFSMSEPLEGHPIKALSFNSNSQNLLVVGGGSQICLMNRNGKRGNESIKGDMYLTDMAKTKGHISSVNTGMFHPYDYNIFATGSSDATVRIWDSEKKLFGIEQQMTHVNLIKCVDSKGIKSEVNKLQYSKDGKIVMIGTLDGSLQGFSTQQFHRPAFCMRGAHASKSEFGGIQFFNDNLRFVSRNVDGTLKLWDLRKFSKPVTYVDNIVSYSPSPGVCIQNEDKYIVTASSVSKNIKERTAFLKFYNSLDLDEISTIEVGEDTITEILWHPNLNQIMFGFGHQVMIYFDPEKSKKGAVQCIQKKPRKITTEELQNNRPIISPNALPQFKSSNTYSLNQERIVKKIRQDPVASHKPEQPIQGPGKAGRIGKQSTVTQFMMNSLNSAPDNREDTQAALLQMQEKAEKNPFFIVNAYQKTQPKAVLDIEDKVQELDEQKFLQKIKQICPYCGLKLCTCKDRFRLTLQEAKSKKQC